jgi:uncharacterized tellurite resistance protein B-like protein
MAISGRRLVPLLLLLLASPAGARVGGGQHYSSSPSHSSSSSSSSHRSGSSGGGSWSGGGGSSSWNGQGSGSDLGLLFFFVNHPLFTLALVAVAIVVWRAYARSFGATATTQRALEQADVRNATPVSSRDISSWVDALQRQDPGFDLVAFLDQAKALFLAVQTAWARRDLASVRRDLSDATFQRLRVQLDLLERQGIRNVTAQMAVVDVAAVGLEQTQAFDTLHVRIRAEARDLDVPASLPEAEALAAVQRAPREPFVEIWSFVRRPATRSRSQGALAPGKCPNCGAPFDGGAAGNCSYCGAIVNSGAYDWVLSEITQGVEAGAAPSEVPGLAELRSADPALSLEVLEDRASLLFWRWIDAQARGEPERLAKLATPALVGELSAESLALRERGRVRAFLQTAVGSVATRAFELGEAQTLAHLEIRWSAQMGIVPVGAPVGPLTTLPQRWIFTLERRASVRTDASRGMATARCGNCGAPLTDSIEPSCEHCGSLLNDGAHDWVLSHLAPFEAWAARSQVEMAGRPASSGASAGRDVVLDPSERQRLLYLMAAMAAADGSVDDRERRMLKLCAERWGVPFANVELALNADPALFEQLMPHNGRGGETFLRSLVQIALVDGKVDRQERRLLETTAARLGLSQQLPELLARFGLG